MWELYAAAAGAVLYGQDPSLIHARRSRLTYGVRGCAPYIEGSPGKFWHNEAGAYFTDAVFNAFVRRGELVGARSAWRAMVCVGM